MCSVEIHTRHPCFRKELSNLIFNLFRAITPTDKFLTSTLRALCGHAIREATIVT